MSLQFSIEISRPRRAVFRALTDPDEVPRHLPLERVVSDGRIGGRFDLHGLADGEPFVDHGRIVQLEADELFAYRYWSTNHGTTRAPENEVLLTYRLRALDANRTELLVVQENLPSREYAVVMGDAWPGLLQGLRNSLESDTRSHAAKGP